MFSGDMVDADDSRDDGRVVHYRRRLNDAVGSGRFFLNDVVRRNRVR
jgi:hypothetical protein